MHNLGFSVVCRHPVFLMMDKLTDGVRKLKSSVTGHTNNEVKTYNYFWKNTAVESMQPIFSILSISKSKFYVQFHSQGHIETGPQHCHLWDSNPQR